MLPALSFISVLPDRGEGGKTMTERSSEIQHLKNQLNQYKLQNDLLGHQLENHRQQMSDVLQDKSILAEELTQKTAHLKSLQAQVEYQTEQRDVNLQKLADLNARVEYMQSRKQDAMKTLQLQSVLIAKTKQECSYVEKRAEHEKKRIEELRAENAELMRSSEETTQAKARETASATTTKGIGRAELMMLQGAHNEISSLTAQSERLNQEIDQLKGVMNSLDLRKRIDEWQKNSEELVEYIERNEASLSHGQPHLLKIAKAILAGDYDDDGTNDAEATQPDPKPARTAGVHSTMDTVGTQKEVTLLPDQTAATKLLMPLAESMLRPMRYLPGSNKRRIQAKRRRYMAMVDSFRDNLRHASRNTDNIVEALQKVLTKGSFSMFRAHFTRYRIERVWLRRQTLKQKCACMGVTTKLKTMIQAKQKLFAAKKQAYLVTIDELDEKVKRLMHELEVKSGSESSLRTIHNFFSTQMLWLQLMVERDQNDIITMESAIEAKDPLNMREIGTEILLQKKQEKAARCLQIQTGCLNVEKDIRLLEWQQKKQNPSAQWVSPNVKWTASGDTGDADTQTDTAYVFTQKLWAGERPFSVKDMKSHTCEVLGDVEISLVTGEEFLVRCVLPICGSQTQLFLYGNLEHVHLQDKEDSTSPSHNAQRQLPAQRMHTTGLDKDGDGAEGKPSAPINNSRATPQTGICLAKLLEVEYIRHAPRLRLTGQDERRDDAARSVTYLDWDCLYNDNQLYTCAVEINGVPFLATLVQCKKTKYGMCFAHLRIYQPLTSWLRWCTLNVRDFCRSLGFPTINAMTSSLGPSTNEGFRKYLVETFKDDLATFDFFEEMVFVLPAIQGDVMVSTTSLRFPEKALMINTYTRMNGEKERRSKRLGVRKKKNIIDQELEEQFKASAQEVVFAKLVVSVDPDSFVDLKIELESAMGADGDSPEAVAAAQKAASKKKKKDKKENRAKRDFDDRNGREVPESSTGKATSEMKPVPSPQSTGGAGDEELKHAQGEK
eukprot:GEMP01005947.1.p1 GENE.GEMP01005947.1~~GEMP01005947.1.p1  ORF type:complete len:1005 (+),score=263.09 GEMP01005947.1:203-3217(+)